MGNKHSIDSGVQFFSSSQTGSSEDKGKTQYQTSTIARQLDQLSAGSTGRRVLQSDTEKRLSELQVLEPTLPVEQQNNLPSVGSLDHHLGTCQPCHFFLQDVGCRLGETCGYCHFRHPQTRGRNRPNKQKRERLRKIVAKRREN